MHIWTIKDQFQSFGEAFRIDQIDPIPFTEQWLIDFGYEDGLKGYHENNFSGLIKVEWSGTIKSWELSIGSMSIVLFNYVHEFQNIIFFLTGEELKLNKQ